MKLKTSHKRCLKGFAMQMVFALGCVSYSHAQLNSNVFEEFTQIFGNRYLINPSVNDTSYNFRVMFDSQNEIGIKSVNRFYVDVDKTLGSSRKNESHHLGLQMTTSKLGEYINKSRFHFRYSWMQQITKKSLLSAGVSVGLVNYAFHTTFGGTGGSDYGPDGNIGIHYCRPKFQFGLALQQFFPTVLIPIDQSFELERYYNLDVSKMFMVSYDFEVQLQGLVQVSESGSLNYATGLFFEFYQKLEVGVNTYSLSKSALLLGVKNIDLLNFKNSLQLAFTRYHGVSNIPGNTLEIFLTIEK